MKDYYFKLTKNVKNKMTYINGVFIFIKTVL